MIGKKINTLSYILVLVAVMVAAYLYMQRTQGIFACPASGYGPHRYLGLCNEGQYGDYDHGAVWFGLEPDVIAGATNADILFIGNSRMEFGFSAPSLDDWARDLKVRHYLLGFSHFENAVFTSPLLDKLHPRARAYVINVDRFFTSEEGELAAQVMHDPAARGHYVQKKYVQTVHRHVCGLLPFLCGGNSAFFRETSDGHWIERGGVWPPAGHPVFDGPDTDVERWPEYQRIARDFIDRLPVGRDCVFLTQVPYTKSRIGEARAIAGSLGMPLLIPDVQGLATFDGSHMNAASAERWTRGFLDLTGGRIQKCLGTTGSPAPSGPSDGAR